MKAIHSFTILLTDCWEIVQGKVVQEFQNWSVIYSVEFDITVTNPGFGWTNVFHFTANGDQANYGDRIPALFINSDGYFHICSAVNDIVSYCESTAFELGKQYQITIRQFKSGGTYWYEIIIDGESKIKIENTQPQSFSSVKLYTSNPWYNHFSSDLGSICNVKIQQDEYWMNDVTNCGKGILILCC